MNLQDTGRLFFNFLENIAQKCVSSATCLLYCTPVDIVVWLISWWFHCVQQGCKFPTLRHAMQYTSRERNHKSSWDCARAQSKRITDVKHNSVTLTIISTENWTIYCGVLDLVSVSNKKFQNKCYRHKYLTSAKQLPRVLLPSWSINVLFNFKEAPPFSTRPLWGVSPMSEDLRMNGIWWLRHLWRQKSGSAYFLVTRVSYKTTLEGKRAQNYMSYTQVSSTFFLDLSSCFNFSSPHITHISQMSCSLPQV